MTAPEGPRHGGAPRRRTSGRGPLRWLVDPWTAPAQRPPANPAPTTRPVVFRSVFVAAACAVCVLFLSVDYLPGADLPQHAMQVSALRNGFPFLDVHWMTPYALAYACAYVLSFVVGAKLAVTIVALIAVLAVPLALLLLVEDPWWALAGFPAAIGYAFYRGLWPFTVAVPLVLILVWAMSRRRVGLAGLLALLLVAAHAQAAAFGIAIAAGMAFAQRQWRSALVLAPAAVLLAAWLLGGSVPAGSPVQGDDLARRFVQLPALIVGGEPPAAAFALGAAIVAVLLLTSRPAPLARWLPFAAALAVVLLAPRDFAGVGYTYPRFAVFVVPFLAFALRPRRRARALVAAIVGLWLGVTAAQWRTWDRETTALGAVMAGAEPGRRLLYLPFDQRSRAFMTAGHGHTGTWYAAERRGWAELSFAASPHVPVRYRDGDWSVPLDVIRRPRWETAWAASFDYVLARGRALDAPELRPLVQRGPWHLYAVASPRPSRAVTPPAAGRSGPAARE